MRSDESRLQKSALGAMGYPAKESETQHLSSPYQSRQPPIEAVPQESGSYGSADWPMLQANHERSSGRACLSRRFAAQRDSRCPKHERSRDAGSDGTRLAPRGPRVANLSGVWHPYPGPRRLLSAHGKQQVCCRFGTFGPAGCMYRAVLARRGTHSRSSREGDSRRLALHPTFPADILNLQQGQSLRSPPHSCVSHRIAGISTGENPFSLDRFQRDTWASHRWDIRLWEPCIQLICAYASGAQVSRVIPSRYLDWAG
jgi:hypothetical protein